MTEEGTIKEKVFSIFILGTAQAVSIVLNMEIAQVTIEVATSHAKSCVDHRQTTVSH